MKCDHCEKDASVHELSVHNGVKIERHLCEQCAEQFGVSVHPQQQITDLIKHYVMKQGLTPVVPPVAQPMRANQCPTCKTTYQEFKQHGLLGCSDCYRNFEGQLTPLVERAHDGGVAHVGKTPKRGAVATPVEADDSAVRALREHRMERIRVLRHELEQAVRDERYEAAARLRDQLRHAENEAPGARPTAESDAPSGGDA
jgi:protein arginine kinase activator